MDGALPSWKQTAARGSDFISSGIRRPVAPCYGVSLFEPSDGANQAWICEQAKGGLSWRVPLKSAFRLSIVRARRTANLDFFVFFSPRALDLLEMMSGP